MYQRTYGLEEKNGVATNKPPYLNCKKAFLGSKPGRMGGQKMPLKRSKMNWDRCLKKKKYGGVNEQKKSG
jgi:hypothetical protein